MQAWAAVRLAMRLDEALRPKSRLKKVRPDLGRQFVVAVSRTVSLLDS